MEFYQIHSYYLEDVEPNFTDEHWEEGFICWDEALKKE